MTHKKAEIQPIDNLFERLKSLIEKARQRVETVVNVTMVYTYFQVGKYIVEYEQRGQHRANYGQTTIKQLSIRLTEQFGTGWSPENLMLCRKFFNIYSTQENVNIVHNVQDEQDFVNTVYKIQDEQEIVNTVYDFQKEPLFTLSWSHYLILMRIKNPQERRFYEIESKKQNWSIRQLQRQYNSSLYERIALSKDKKEVLRLSQQGQNIEKPQDVIKNPLTLEFLGLRTEEIYSETTLETAIINKLQLFLLEMGKGFLFEARQKRFTFEEDNFYVDLVLYNRLLQCYCLIDLKVDKLTHQDLGQMQMYVNYFDRFIKQPFEKPTIGILVCKEKKMLLWN